MEGQSQEQQLKARLVATLLDPNGKTIEAVEKTVEQGAESVLLMQCIRAVAETPRQAVNKIAIGHGEVCYSCDGIDGSGFGDCPIFAEMFDNFGSDPESLFCPFYASGERLSEDDEDAAQDSSEAPSEAISEPVSEAVSEPISEAKSGPEIPAEKWTDNWCKRCGAEVHPSHLIYGKRLFYNVEVLSERHLCADCVLDLMRTDPTCQDVMQYVERQES